MTEPKTMTVAIHCRCCDEPPEYRGFPLTTHEAEIAAAEVGWWIGEGVYYCPACCRCDECTEVTSF